MDFIGFLVHDCWGSYFKLDKVSHALCGAHLVRELRGVLSRARLIKQDWAQEMLDLIYEMYEKKKELMLKGFEMGCKGLFAIGEIFPQCTKEEIESFKQRYIAILEKGFKTNKVSFDAVQDKKVKHTKTVNLLFRMRDHMDEWLAWIIDVRLPFCNNMAEQSFRCIKTWQDVSKFVRTDKGLVIRCILLSIIQSAKKQDLSAFQAIISMLKGVPPEVFFGCEVSESVRASTPERKINIKNLFNTKEETKDEVQAS